MNKILLFLFCLTCSMIVNAQHNITISYDSNLQYHNFNNKLNSNNSEIVIRDANKATIRKIIISENKVDNYRTLSEIADSFYLTHNYAIASLLYVHAIRLNNNLGKVKHRYKWVKMIALMEVNLKRIQDSLNIEINRNNHLKQT